MSLQKLNKIPDLKPEKEIAEAHQGPSKTLTETLEVMVSNHGLKPFAHMGNNEWSCSRFG